MENLIVDCDIGVDDAAAVIMLLKNQKKAKIRLISTIAGNSKLSNVTNNTIFVLRNFAPYWIPVAVGSDKPLFGKRNLDASDVHGESGLGGLKVPQQEKPKFVEGEAEDVLYQKLMSNKKTTLVAIGPLTNIAKLIQKYPKIAKKIKKIVIMGGSISGIGNVTPYAEYNFAWDAQAAKIVLQSGIKIYLSPIENANNMPVTDADVLENLKDEKNQKIFKKIFLNLKDAGLPYGFALHDACAAAYILKPALFKQIKCNFIVNDDKKDKRCGQCFCEINNKAKNYVIVPKNYEKIKKYILKTTFGG